MSPGFNAVMHWPLDLLGGRSSARSLHFICAGIIDAFIVVHLTLVLLADPVQQMGDPGPGQCEHHPRIVDDEVGQDHQVGVDGIERPVG